MPLSQDLLERAEKVGQKCTFCAHLLDAGWKEPRCVEACPTGTLIFGDLDDPDSAVSKAWKQAEAMHPEYGLGEGVRYIGLPKNFVAGAVVYGDIDECAKGVTVTLAATAPRSPRTDGFGDFEFEGLPMATTTRSRFPRPATRAGSSMYGPTLRSSWATSSSRSRSSGNTFREGVADGS